MDSPAVGSLERIAPIFTVRDVLASLAYYRQLGFVAREYAGGGYRFVTRDGIEIHTSARYLTAIRGLSALRRRSGLAMPMTSLGPGARRERRYDRRRTPTGDRHEGVLIDPDGNIIRFGSPARKPQQPRGNGPVQDPE